MKAGTPLQDDKLKELFKEMPLEKPSLNFTENLMLRIEKEALKSKKKRAALNVLSLAAALVSMLLIPGLILYLCRIHLPGFTLSLPPIHFDSTVALIGVTSLLLLMADTLIRNRVKKE